ASSWGVSTRLMGALIMSHSDDNGLVLPPKLAPIQVVIIPIYKSMEELDAMRSSLVELQNELRKAGLSVKFDDRDTHKPGFKFAEYELKGVPVRLAIGQRDLANNTVEVARRDLLTKETRSRENITEYLVQLMDKIQDSIYQKSFAFRDANIFEINSWDEFLKQIELGGFLSAHWDGTVETEEKIKAETKATIRCIPLDFKEEAGTCVFSGKPSVGRVLFARAY
ncbi:MAG: proline--tRNA ligase, partial [Bacteroidales bacterium]|nr:proline--tRNA ligase [Bacteroidales bacterium]